MCAFFYKCVLLTGNVCKCCINIKVVKAFLQSTNTNTERFSFWFNNVDIFGGTVIAGGTLQMRWSDNNSSRSQMLLSEYNSIFLNYTFNISDFYTVYVHESVCWRC